MVNFRSWYANSCISSPRLFIMSISVIISRNQVGDSVKTNYETPQYLHIPTALTIASDIRIFARAKFVNICENLRR